MNNTKKVVDIRCRVDQETKEKWSILCSLNSWNGSDKIRKYVESLISLQQEEVNYYYNLKREEEENRRRLIEE